MGKHSYVMGCECGRCSKEATRRATQAEQNRGRQAWAQPVRRFRKSAQDRREAHLMACWDAGKDDTSDWG